MDINKCKERIGDGTGFHFYQCSRNIWKDGYCKQHHPDTRAEKNEKAAKRWEEKFVLDQILGKNLDKYKIIKI